MKLTIQILSMIDRHTNKLGVTTAQIEARSHAAPKEIDERLSYLLEIGTVACTNGRWYRRTGETARTRARMVRSGKADPTWVAR